MNCFWQAPSFKLLIRQLIYFFEQLLFPSKCLKCGVYLPPQIVEKKEIDNFFCDRCKGVGIRLIDSPYCTLCGMKFLSTTDKNHVCETCIKTPLLLGKVRASVEYKGIIKDAVPLFKYQAKLSLLPVFESLLFQAFIQYYNDSEIDFVLPVPLHRHKLKERGFNQSYLMVRNFENRVKKRTGMLPSWQMDISSLRRIKKTAPQTGFGIKERKKNLKNAFRIVHPDKIKNKHILLIDDVFTTGATCNEAAKELLKSGAKQVDALVLAIA